MWFSAIGFVGHMLDNILGAGASYSWVAGSHTIRFLETLFETDVVGLFGSGDTGLCVTCGRLP